MEEKNQNYLALAGAGTRAFPEMVRLLEAMAARGLKLGCASGSSPHVIERVLTATQLRAPFHAVVSAEEVPKGKPAPDVFLEVARRLEVPCDECLAIEDSGPGVESAKRAFMRCIAVPSFVDSPLPDAFLMADLLFEGGMDSFSAEAALQWSRREEHL